MKIQVVSALTIGLLVLTLAVSAVARDSGMALAQAPTATPQSGVEPGPLSPAPDAGDAGAGGAADVESPATGSGTDAQSDINGLTWIVLASLAGAGLGATWLAWHRRRA
jgi:hypothetical protein